MLTRRTYAPTTSSNRSASTDDPRSSWTCEGAAAQTAYRFVARRDGQVVWDTGTVASAVMTGIRWAGPELRSRDVVEWGVRL